MTFAGLRSALAWTLVAGWAGCVKNPPTAPPSVSSSATVVPLSPPLPPGQAEAFFRLRMAGDVMSDSVRPSTLVLVLRYGATEASRDIASCHEAALGSALGGGTGDLLEVAGCDGEVHLLARAGAVEVERVDDAGRASPLTRVSLPQADLRAASPEPQRR